MDRHSGGGTVVIAHYAAGNGSVSHGIAIEAVVVIVLTAVNSEFLAAERRRSASVNLIRHEREQVTGTYVFGGGATCRNRITRLDYATYQWICL